MFVCASVCVCERVHQGQSEVLLDRAFNWPFHRPHPKRALREDGDGLLVTSAGSSGTGNRKKDNCPSPYLDTCLSGLYLNAEVIVEGVPFIVPCSPSN